MSIGRQDIIRYTLSTAAFLAALAVTSGCGMFHHEKQLVVRPQPAPVTVKAPPAAVAKAVPVNAFGEFAGVRNTPASKQTSQAFQQHTFAVDGRDSEVTVDPSGKFLAYSSTRHSERPDIYLQRADGVSVVQLTDDPSDDAFPAFSPDGKTIAFSSTRGGNWDIYTMDTDGRHVVQITNGLSQDLHPSFSPDGTRLVYCSMGSRSDNWELWVVNVQTGERRMIGYGLFPTWSPDKSAERIAFQRASQRGSRWFSLWTLNLVDGEAHQVTEVASAADAAIVSPTWSPDGQKIAYAAIRPAPAGTPNNASEQKEIWSVNVDGTDRRRLTDGIGANLSPAWAVDNRVYFVSDRSGAESIWSVRAEQSVPTVAAGHEAPAREVAVEPQQKHDVPAAAVSSTDTHEVAH